MSQTEIDLRHLRIASPCSEKWSAMGGDERVRFCGKCRLNVYNVAELSSAEVRALIVKTEGRLCGRIYRRRDGSVITKDCPVGLRKARMKIAAALTAVVSLTLAAIGTIRTQARDAAVFDGDDNAPSAVTGPFWSKVRVRAVQYEDQAREVPVIGPLIEKIDPEPPSKMVAGKMIAIPPPSTPTSGEI